MEKNKREVNRQNKTSRKKWRNSKHPHFPETGAAWCVSRCDKRQTNLLHEIALIAQKTPISHQNQTPNTSHPLQNTNKNCPCHSLKMK
jgi:hypothetical protein